MEQRVEAATVAPPNAGSSRNLSEPVAFVIMVGLLVYALLGLAADQLVRAIERSALVWRPTIARRGA